MDRKKESESLINGFLTPALSIRQILCQRLTGLRIIFRGAYLFRNQYDRDIGPQHVETRPAGRLSKKIRSLILLDNSHFY